MPLPVVRQVACTRWQGGVARGLAAFERPLTAGRDFVAGVLSPKPITRGCGEPARQALCDATWVTF